MSTQNTEQEKSIEEQYKELRTVAIVAGGAIGGVAIGAITGAIARESSVGLAEIIVGGIGGAIGGAIGGTPVVFGAVEGAADEGVGGALLGIVGGIIVGAIVGLAVLLGESFGITVSKYRSVGTDDWAIIAGIVLAAGGMGAGIGAIGTGAEGAKVLGVGALVRVGGGSIVGFVAGLVSGLLVEGNFVLLFSSMEGSIVGIVGAGIGAGVKEKRVIKLLPLVKSPQDIDFLLSKIGDKTQHADLLTNALRTALSEGRRQSFALLHSYSAFDEKARKIWLAGVQDKASLTRLMEWQPQLMQEYLEDVIKTGNTARAALLAECGLSPSAAALKNASAEMRAVFLDEPVKRALQNKDLAYLKTVQGSGYTFSTKEKAQVFALAVAKKDYAHAERLINEGLDISAQTCLPAVTRAVLSKNTESLRKALAGGELPTEEWHGQSLLEYAVDKGWNEGAKLLFAALKDIKKPLGSGSYPIHVAITSQNLGIVQGLIQRKADLNTKDGKGRSPLALAVELRLTDIGMELIKAGAKP